MATLKDLVTITGKKSISDMTDEELREHLYKIREDRKKIKKKEKPCKTLKLSEITKEKKTSKTSKSKEPTLTREQIIEILTKLGESPNGSEPESE